MLNSHDTIAAVDENANETFLIYFYSRTTSLLEPMFSRTLWLVLHAFTILPIVSCG
jgi:hypothetical protein